MTDLSKIKAEMGHYSSVVGNSVHLIADDGRMIGQIAILCHTDELRDKDVQTALCDRIVQAFDPDALIRRAIEEGLRMAADKARGFGLCSDVRPATDGGTDYHRGYRHAAVDISDEIKIWRTTSPEALTAAVERVKGGE